jgi:hypothetical protein
MAEFEDFCTNVPLAVYKAVENVIVMEKAA